MRRLFAVCALGCAEGPAVTQCVPATGAQLVPADGAVGVAVDAGLSVTSVGEGAEVWVDGGVTDGWQPVVGSGDIALSALFLADTRHVARVRHCGEIVAESRFATGPAPVGAGLDGRTFLVDLLSPELEWVEPSSPPAPMLLRALLSDTRGILLSVTGDDAIVAIAEDETGEVRQDACLPAVGGVARTGTDPEVAIGPIDVTFDGEATTIEGIQLSAVAADGGETLRGLRVQGRVDMRRVGGSTGEALCGALQPAYASTCVPCTDQADADAPMCMLLDATLPSSPARDIPVSATPPPHSWCR